MKLAIFDLDQTLIAGDSDRLWGEFMSERGQVDAAAYRRANAGFYEASLIESEIPRLPAAGRSGTSGRGSSNSPPLEGCPPGRGGKRMAGFTGCPQPVVIPARREPQPGKKDNIAQPPK